MAQVRLEQVLENYVKSQIKHSWDWHKYNCTTFVNDWAVRVCDVDFMRAYRGCDNAKDCLTLYNKLGGAYGLLDMLPADKYPKLRDPELGSVGVIRASLLSKEPCTVLCIAEKPGWFVYRGMAGVSYVRGEPAGMFRRLYTESE